MLGSILGDIIGSVYEGGRVKTKDFKLFRTRSRFTDDSVLTLATADWLLHGGDAAPYYSRYATKYDLDHRGFGSRFKLWVVQCVVTGRHEAYNSCGNGSAMRVGPVGWAFDTPEEVLSKAQESASCTHNHPEGIKGAQATALAIMLARQGKSKDEIREAVTHQVGYDLSKTCDEIRPSYKWNATCQGSVPEAIMAFLDSTDYEDCIRNAVSLGGDSDTIACIAGSIAEAFYGIPQKLYDRGMSYLPPELQELVREFEKAYGNHILPNATQAATSAAGPNETADKTIFERPAFTPDKIKHLHRHEVFVFGSNLAGHHGGGAARLAYQKFGAVWGQGVGLMGQSYAIPTMQGGIESIRPYVDDFIAFAREHPELLFYVTRIGCGIAGFKEREIAPLFRDAIAMENVVLPRSFCMELVKMAE